MSKRFSVHKDDKRLHIVGPNDGQFDLEISIDYDDVYHREVMRQARQLCQILDMNWPRP